MSQFTKSLQTRIHELTASIDGQKAELASYEHLLEIETAKNGRSTEESPKSVSPTEAASPQGAAVAPAGLAGITITGNKTTLVADVVRAHGKSGASPKDVDKFFTERKIKRSKNLIYNTLSYLVSQKKLQRKDGRYYGAVSAAVPEKAATAAKRRLSPAGLKRIREAVKKRWAAKRAADKAAAK